MSRKLSEKQYAAIALLALPNRGGLTYAEIAEEVGVTERTIYNWKNDERFDDEIRKQVIRNLTDRLGDLYDAAIKSVTVDHNAAMFRTLVQSAGMLTEKVELDTKDNRSVDIDEIKARLATLKGNEHESDD